jgi:hypothetical protein
MPNWCDNTLTIRAGNQADIKRFAQALEAGEFLNSVIPVPEELKIVAGVVGSDDSPEQIALVEAEERNLKTYGAKNWYDFCVARWGTKWDVECDDVIISEDGLELTASFSSAWSPPLGVYEQLVELGYYVDASYHEGGMAFVGRWDNGDDDYYEYGGYTSNTVRKAIGEYLDDQYGISEQMAQYEDEENEED